ncbi:MAG: diaminobutyrate acetyltransferase [Alcaligenaceae bacterium]|nr:diaminobutyrate acetyltransferase [Alcaligenaceae bacterium]
MHRLVCDCPPLDVNSLYVYLLLCEHFSQTCIVSEDDHGLNGMVTGYVPPGRPDVLFVWQVAVAARMRGQGLGRCMLLELCDRTGMEAIQYIETTVSPGNRASRSMFAGLAQSLNTECAEHPLFDAPLFGPGEHDAEPLLRIGPFGAHRQRGVPVD